ncbi:hypothetical protein IGI04_040352 [Brassica rapa subsp. trilocularis]|uniref:Uncharacterized protein n=1 Tax=Brassica rapa subsp. trilocularis TaxID=1813537 RepID=A0ABQ7KRR1_BRACM|nr:hypothetical protein IGI04_040352 [Brassica rapa subsp. trilocularis]
MLWRAINAKSLTLRIGEPSVDHEPPRVTNYRRPKMDPSFQPDPSQSATEETWNYRIKLYLFGVLCPGPWTSGLVSHTSLGNLPVTHPSLFLISDIVGGPLFSGLEVTGVTIFILNLHLLSDRGERINESKDEDINQTVSCRGKKLKRQCLATARRGATDLVSLPQTF